MTGTPVFEAHRNRLLARFAADVARLGATSLLDVGCGFGRLLSELRSHVPELRGVERSERRRSACLEAGLDVVDGVANELAFDDDSFDWVVIRHVLHHLDDPAVAVKEACRVARRGVVLAEPMADVSIPSQLAMTQLDALTTQLMAKVDHIHHPYLSAGALIDLVPWDAPSIESRSYGEMTRVPEEEVHALVTKAAHGRELDPSERAELEDLATAAARGEITYNGSLAVFVRSGASA